MSDVNDWPVVASPSGEKAGNVPFGVRIISRSIGRVVSRIDGPLHINHEQRGAGETRHADTSPNVSLRTQYIALSRGFIGLVRGRFPRVANGRLGEGILATRM